MFVNESPATLDSICLLRFFRHFGQAISPVLTCYMTFFNTHDQILKVRQMSNRYVVAVNVWSAANTQLFMSFLVLFTPLW